MKSENSTAQIKCTSYSHNIHFSQLHSVHITNLEFIGCGGNQVQYVEEFVVEDTKFEGKQNSGTALELLETTAWIVNSTFVSNRGSFRERIDFPNYFSYGFFGGAIIATNTSIEISQSMFEDNGADFGGAILTEHSTINMSGTTFINNNAIKYDGRVLASSSSTIIIQASKFRNNYAKDLGGVLASFDSTAIIVASHFHNNSANFRGGVLHSEDSTITIEASHGIS